MSNLKASDKTENPLSSSEELESSELESAELVECPAFGELSRKKCLDYQSINEIARSANPLYLTMWKACRSGCKNSLIGPDGRPIEREEIKAEETNDDFVLRLKGLIKKDFKDNEAAFAREADLSQGGLRRYLSGGDPTRAKLIKIAKAAKVHLLWLATGEGPKYTEGPKKEAKSPKLILDPSMPSGFNRSLVFIRKATTAVELMGRDAPTERKVEAVEKVYKRLSETDGAADMIEIMQLIQATLEGDTKLS